MIDCFGFLQEKYDVQKNQTVKPRFSLKLTSQILLILQEVNPVPYLQKLKTQIRLVSLCNEVEPCQL